MGWLNTETVGKHDMTLGASQGGRLLYHQVNNLQA